MDEELVTLPEAAAAMLRLLDDRADNHGEFMIVSTPDGRNMFVQFLLQEDGTVYAEAKGNYYAESPDDWLGAAQLSLLDVLGWEPPATEPDADHYNHWREWPAGTASTEIVGVLLDTLLAVYMRGHGEGACVEVKVGSFDDEVSQ